MRRRIEVHNTNVHVCIKDVLTDKKANKTHKRTHRLIQIEGTRGKEEKKVKEEEEERKRLKMKSKNKK